MSTDGVRNKSGMTPEQEKQCVLSAQGGNEDAFAVLMRHYMPYAYKIIWNVFASYAHPSDCITDMTQDVWLQIWNHLSKYEYLGEGSFKAWIGTIVRRKSINHVQSCHAGRGESEVDMTSIPDSSAYKPRTEVWEAVLQAIHDLEANTRNAFILHLLFQRNQRDTAVLMDKSLGKTNTLIAEAKEKVQRFLLARGIDQNYLIPGLFLSLEAGNTTGPATKRKDGPMENRKPVPGVLKHMDLWRSFTGCLGSVEETGQRAVLLQWVLGVSIGESAKVLKLSPDSAADLVITKTKEVQQCLDRKGYSLASYSM